MTKLEIFLKEAGCFDVRHSGKSLGDHLLNTAFLLDFIEAPEHVVMAGGLHSIYGTNAFKQEVLGPEDRDKIREVFGEKVERLAFMFSKINRPFELEKVSASGGTVAGCEDLSFDLSPEDVRDLRLMEVANLLEQEASIKKYPKMVKVFEDQVNLRVPQPVEA